MLGLFARAETDLPLRGLGVPVITLAVAATGARLMLPLARWRGGDTWGAVLYVAAEMAITLAAAGAAMRLFGNDGTGRASLALLTLTALWFAPAMVFAGRGPVWATACGALMAGLIANCAGSFERGAPADQNRFQIIAAATALQTGIIALAAGYARAAVCLTALSCFFIVWQAERMAKSETTRARERSSRARLPASVAAAIALVIGGVRLCDAGAGQGGEAEPSLSAGPGAGKNLHSGVILLPLEKRSALLVPVPRTPARAIVRAKAARPMSLLFSGEYWFFYSPLRLVASKLIPIFKSPPESSLVERGDPATWNLTLMDPGVPLMMKAHQSLSGVVKTADWERIDVALMDADAQPGSYTVELLLVDSIKWPAVYQSLGEAAVPEHGGESWLRFVVPAVGRVPEFNAMDVAFHLGRERRSRSANATVDRFEFVPRGK